MGLNLVSETYPYPWISLPTDEELADTGKNICYYDWVRAYTLIGVDEASTKVDPLIVNGGFETGNYTGWTGWPSPYDLEFTSEEAHVYSGTYAVHIVGAQGLEQIVFGLKPNTDYTLSCYSKVVSGSMLLEVKDGATGVISCTEPTYTRKSLNFTSDNSKRVTIYYNAMSENDEGYADDFELVETNPVSEPQNETVMFNEKLYFSESANVKTALPSLAFLITYMANANREINLQLYNSDSVLVGNQKYLALAGFGKKQFIMQLDSLLSPG
ncbi:unnamed protein product, partial [marine sediment metagenome]